MRFLIGERYSDFAAISAILNIKYWLILSGGWIMKVRRQNYAVYSVVSENWAIATLR